MENKNDEKRLHEGFNGEELLKIYAAADFIKNNIFLESPDKLRKVLESALEIRYKNIEEQEARNATK
ncbi:MAG: hypothetical protein WKF87_06895 [Chryseolinea sp.]